MYRVDRNNFHKNEKNATVYTPSAMSNYIFRILDGKVDKNKTVFDPCVGAGSLLKPFKDAGYEVLGIDIEKQGFEHTIVKNYLEIKKGEIKNSLSLVIMNPPFNVDDKTKEYIKKNYGGRPLLPEVWFKKAIELFGKNIPIVMFTPYGFRLNQTVESKRWKNFINGIYPSITSIISLPKDLFDNILFHSEILIFNIKGLKAHYFYNN